MLQVCDLLADRQCSNWITRLRNKVSTYLWEEGSETEESICALLYLPAHLQHAMFSTMPESSELSKVWKKLPYALHTALLTSQVSLSGHLELTFSSMDPLPLASLHVSKLHLPRPGLVSLSLTATATPCSPYVPPTSMARFAVSIVSHTTLTCLHLHSFGLRDSGAVVLSQQLTALTRLRELWIMKDVFYGPGLIALGDAVRFLSNLEELAVSEIHVPHSETGATSTARAACEQFMQALSTAPKLRKLYIDASRLPCSASAVHGGFKELEHLCIRALCCENPCHDFLLGLTHLTHLALVQEDDFAVLDSFERHQILYLLELASQIESLVSLTLDVHLDDGVEAEYSEVTAGMRDCLGSLPNLKSLTMLNSNWCVDLSDADSVGLAVRGAKQWDWMANGAPLPIETMVLRDVYTGLSSNGCDCVIKHLKNLTGLRSLTLDLFSEDISLGRLNISSLTHLCIRQVEDIRPGDELAVRCEAFSKSFQSMSMLQRLELSNLYYDDFGDLFTHVSSLVALKSLKLSHYCPAAGPVNEAGSEGQSHVERQFRLGGPAVAIACDYMTNLGMLEDLHMAFRFTLPDLGRLADLICGGLSRLSKLFLTYDSSVVSDLSGPQAQLVKVDPVVVAGVELYHKSGRELPKGLADVLVRLRGAVKETQLVQFGQQCESSSRHRKRGTLWALP